MPSEHLKNCLRLVKQRKFSYAIHLLESYDFTWVHGEAFTEEGHGVGLVDWLLMYNPEEQLFIEVLGNKYFGCSAEFVTFDKLNEKYGEEHHDAFYRFVITNGRNLLGDEWDSIKDKL